MKTLSSLQKLILFSALPISFCASTAIAQDADNLFDAISNGDAYLDERFRVEHVSDDAFAETGTASTLRSKLGYKTKAFKGFSGTLEFEHSAELFGGEYNDGINGKTTYPAIIDANHTEVNQAYLAYTGIKNTTLAAGRQALNLGNQRFVGTVGWRQNDQTYDAAAIITSPVEGLTAVYGFVWNVNRIFGNDHPMGDLKTKTHVINVTYKAAKELNIEAYGLMIDLDAQAAKGLNSKTFGVRLSGGADIADGAKLVYAAEYANQTEHTGNPANFSVDFYNVEGGVNFNGFTVKGGIETLGSENGVASFKTPLATLHKFNGWADKFLNTPANGLRDLYVHASYGLKDTGTVFDGVTLTAVYHKFESDVGDIDYGSEVDLSLATKIDRFNVLLKYANYNAETWSVDTSKFWFQVATKF